MGRTVHMNGRVYDPYTAKFLSADPFVQDPTNGQSYNRYSYVLNNPTNLTDPTGFFAQTEEQKKYAAELNKKIEATLAAGGIVAVQTGANSYSVMGSSGALAQAGLKSDGSVKAGSKDGGATSKGATNSGAGVSTAATGGVGVIATHPDSPAYAFLAPDKFDKLSEYFSDKKRETGNFLYGNLAQWTHYIADHEQELAGLAGAIRGVKGAGGRLGVPGEEFVPGTNVSGPYVRPSGAGPTLEQRASVQGKPCVECGALSKNMVADHKDPLVVQHYREGSVNVSQQRQVDSVQPHCPSCSSQQGGYLSAFSRGIKSLLGF